MRVSQFYNIGKTQPSLEFLDVDIEKDTALFLNARAIRLLKSDLGDHCTDLIQDFFFELIQAIKSGKHQRALEILSHLRGLHPVSGPASMRESGRFEGTLI